MLVLSERQGYTLDGTPVNHGADTQLFALAHGKFRVTN